MVECLAKRLKNKTIKKINEVLIPNTEKINVIRTLFLTLLFLSLPGCNEFCGQEVEDITYLENQSGAALSIEVCISSDVGSKTINITADENGRFSLGGREITYDNSQIDQGCDRVDGEEVIHSIKLTSTNFSTVKFCHPTEITSNTILIQSSNACPTGTTEQTTPSTECSNNDATGF